RAGLDAGKRYTVIAFDQPSCGYSSMVDYTKISANEGIFSDPEALLHPDELGSLNVEAMYPLVDFLEDFVVSFVNTLDNQQRSSGPNGIADRIAAVIGGSLGGCLSLRLGRPRADAAWVKRVVPWSPASVWTSYNQDLLKGIGLNSGKTR